MQSEVEENFSDYYEKWMLQLEDYLQLLLKASKEQFHESDHKALVAKLTAHHKDYYTAKWAAAHDDVLAFFSPVWLTPLENAHLWLTGWKPSTAFRLINSLRLTTSPPAHVISEAQVKKIEGLKAKIRAEEEKVEREMERQQVAMADRRMVELLRLASRVKGGGGGEAVEMEGLVTVAMKGLLASLERVMKMADCVRLKALKGVLDVLSPVHCVEFLAATAALQIQLKKLGRKRDGCCGGDENENLNHVKFV